MRRDVEIANLDRSRRVDRSAFSGDLKSGLIESKMFVHNNRMRGREGG